MKKNQFCSHKYFSELYCPSNSEHKKTWAGAKTFIYDPLIRSNILVLNYNSKLTSKIASIKHRYLVIQMSLYPTNSFSITLSAVDREGFKKRIIFINSNNTGKKHDKSNIIRFNNISTCTWVNLNIDVFSFFELLYKDMGILEINEIEISGNLKLKKIISTSAIPDSFEFSSISELKYNNGYKALSHIFNSINYSSNIKEEYYMSS